MASYTQIGDKKYKIFVELGYNELGKRIRKTKTVTATSDRDLKKKIRDFEIQCFTDQEVPLEDMTFEQFIDRWMKNYVEPDLTEGTLHAYQYLLDTSLLEHFGKIKLKNIKKLHLVEYFKNEKNEKRRNLTGKYTTLRSIFAKAVEWELLINNPMEGIKEPEVEKMDTDYYNEKELLHLFDVLEDCYPKHRIMIKLAAIGGLRRGEVMGIREESIDFENNSILIDKQLKFHRSKKYFYLGSPKNKKSRTVFFPNDFMKELKSYCTKHKQRRMELGNLWKGIYDDEGNMINLVFTKEDGYPALPNSLGNEWRKIIKRYDLKPISFHELRHSSASLMVKKGVNFKLIQERLGHSDIGITLNRYSHVSDEEEKEAANVFGDIL